MNEKEETTGTGKKEAGDCTGKERIWEEKYNQALEMIKRGNNYRARKILSLVEKESHIPALKKSAAETLKTLSTDPWFYILWGISAAFIVFIFVYYILLR